MKSNAAANPVDVPYGTIIQQARKASGITQTTLFERLLRLGLSWSQSTLSKVESGSRPLRFSEGVAVAQALGISLDELSGSSSPSNDLAEKARSHELDVMEQFIHARRAALVMEPLEDPQSGPVREQK